MSARALASAVAVALSMSIVACGDSDDGGSGSGGGEGAASTSTTAAGAGGPNEESAVRRALIRIQDSFYAADAEAWCSHLTERAAAESARTLGQNGTCEAAVRKYISEPVPPREAKRLRSRIVKVSVDGDKAIVVTRQGKTRTDRAPFVKQDGKWKLDSGLSAS